MSDGSDIIRRLTEGDGRPREVEKHEVVFRQVDETDPPGLLRRVAGDVRERIPETVDAGFRWVQAKGKQAEARANKIQAEGIAEISRVQNETQELIQQREERKQKAASEIQRDLNAHEEELRKLESQSLNDVVDCIVRLREAGIVMDITVIREVERAMKRHLKGR